MLTMDVDIALFKRFRVASVAEPVFYTEDKYKFVFLLALPNFCVRTIVSKTDKENDWIFYMRELYSQTAHKVLTFHGIEDKMKELSVQASDEVIENPEENAEQEVNHGVIGRWY